MVSNNLFDEDSSDEEDDDGAPLEASQKSANDWDKEDTESVDKKAELTEKEKTQTKSSRVMNVDDDDDNDEADEEDGENNENEFRSDDEEEVKTKKKVIHNPDEEDVEFDDDGGIVGSAARTPMETDEKSSQNRRMKKMTVLKSKRPGENTTICITKLPNVVGIQPDAFDVDTYNPEQEDKEYNGYVHNMIRWRYKKDKDGNFVRSNDGKLIRESNARIVKWDDGSLTLHVGTEIFICDQRIAGSSSNPGLNGYLYLSQKATGDDDDDGHNDGEQVGGTVLECMGAINSKLTVRPSSLQSAAHKALTVAVRQKTTKRATIAQIVTHEDPEKMKEERIRQKTDLEKAKARRSSSGRHYSSTGRRAPAMNRRYIEEEEDGNYDSVNIRDLKRRNLPVGDDDMMDYGDDDSDDDEDDDVGWSKGKLAAMRNKKKRSRTQSALYDDDDEEEEEFGVGDDDSDEEAQVTQKKPKRVQASLFDDDDDE